MDVSARNEEAALNSKVIDYDIQDIVGIRVIDATIEDAIAISDQLGERQRHLTREPDIIIRFKEKLHTPSLTYLDSDSCGFTDEGFYIFSKKEGAKLRVPFERIGNQCEVLCESGIQSVPWLTDIINFTFLTKGYVPVHASAFVYDGVGVVVTGWSKGGKTAALLCFANKGAHYVGDEWVILSSDGKEMFGTAAPICVWEWYLKETEDLLPAIPFGRKILFKAIHLLDAMHMGVRKGKFKSSSPAKLLAKAVPALMRQLNISVSPDLIFNDRLRQVAEPHKVILSLSHNDRRILVQACDACEIAKQIVISNAFEQTGFLGLYRAFKFAFPRLRNEYLENSDQIQLSLLCSALKKKEAYKVWHPYPVPLEEYFKHLKPLCENVVKAGQ
jgi:hypothetical protein